MASLSLVRPEKTKKGNNLNTFKYTPKSIKRRRQFYPTRPISQFSQMIKRFTIV